MNLSKFFTLIIAASLTAFTFSCQPKNFNEPGVANTKRERTSLVYRTNFEKTWNAVNQVASMYPVVSSKKENGTVLTDWIKGKSDRLFSGYGENRIPYTIRYKFYIKVRPTSKGTLVDIRNKEQYFTDSVTSGIDFSGSIYQWLDTESSTLKEALFLEKVSDNLFPKKK